MAATAPGGCDDLRLVTLQAFDFQPPGVSDFQPALTGVTFKAARIQRNPVPVVLSTDSLFWVTAINEPTPDSGLHPDGDRFIFAQNVLPWLLTGMPLSQSDSSLSRTSSRN